MKLIDKNNKGKIGAFEVGTGGALLGAGFLPEDFLDPALNKIVESGSPVGHFIEDNVEIGGPGEGFVLNAATSGIGALAAYGLLKKMKKAKEERFNRKLELAKAKNSHIIKVDRSE